jgi:hypothetical protein
MDATRRPLTEATILPGVYYLTQTRRRMMDSYRTLGLIAAILITVCEVLVFVSTTTGVN